MVVSLTWSLSSGGPAAADPHDHGTIAAGGSNTVDLYVSHNGVNKISNCAWLIQPYTGSGYTGANGQIADYNEIISWGDTYYAGGAWTGAQGGFFINQDSAGSFPASADDYFYTDHGTSGHGVQLAGTSTIGGVNGEIAAGDESHIKAGIYVPAGVTASGIRFVDQRLIYDYTS